MLHPPNPVCWILPIQFVESSQSLSPPPPPQISFANEIIDKFLMEPATHLAAWSAVPHGNGNGGGGGGGGGNGGTGEAGSGNGDAGLRCCCCCRRRPWLPTSQMLLAPPPSQSSSSGAALPAHDSCCSNPYFCFPFRSPLLLPSALSLPAPFSATLPVHDSLPSPSPCSCLAVLLVQGGVVRSGCAGCCSRWREC